MIAHGRRGFVGQRSHLFVVTKYYEHPAMPAPNGTWRPKAVFGTVGSRPDERQRGVARVSSRRAPAGSRRDPANKDVVYTCEASYHRGTWQRVVVWVSSSRASRQHEE